MGVLVNNFMLRFKRDVEPRALIGRWWKGFLKLVFYHIIEGFWPD